MLIKQVIKWNPDQSFCTTQRLLRRYISLTISKRIQLVPISLLPFLYNSLKRESYLLWKPYIKSEVHLKNVSQEMSKRNIKVFFSH